MDKLQYSVCSIMSQENIWKCTINDVLGSPGIRFVLGLALSCCAMFQYCDKCIGVCYVNVIYTQTNIEI